MLCKCPTNLKNFSLAKRKSEELAVSESGQSRRDLNICRSSPSSPFIIHFSCRQYGRYASDCALIAVIGTAAVIKFHCSHFPTFLNSNLKLRNNVHVNFLLNVKQNPRYKTITDGWCLNPHLERGTNSVIAVKSDFWDVVK